MQQAIVDAIDDQLLVPSSALDQELSLLGIRRQLNRQRRFRQRRRCDIPEMTHPRRRGHRVQLHQQLRNDLGGSKIVLHRGEITRGIESFEQHRTRRHIMFQEPHRSASGPCSERRGFTTGLVVNWLQLEHCLRAIVANHRNDQRNCARGNRAVDPQLPSIHVGSSQSRKSSDPRPAGLT
jgi:hypothetical protein